MRIAIVDPASFTPPYDHGLATALARRGHQVELVTSAFVFGVPPAPDGYRRHEVFLPLSTRLTRRSPRSRLRLVVKGLEYGPSVLRLTRRLESLDPDVVHLQWLPLPRVDRRWVERLAGRRRTVLTAHDVRPRRRGQDEAWLAVLRAVDRVVVHSARAVEQLVGMGLDRARVARIAHPIFQAPSGEPLAPPAGRTLLFFGLLRAYKGLDVLLAALPSVLERVPDARLVIAGDPVDPVGPLQEQAARLGVEGSVEWRLRYLAEEEIVALLAAAAAVVLPYRELDSSGALATALGLGRPAVVTDVGSLGETVREHGAGLVVPPQDAAALADACVQLLTDTALLASAYEGTGRARAALTWEASARAHEELYREVAGG
jgi:glycosyltransferase involved in cell wall biosynthesis